MLRDIKPIWSQHQVVRALVRAALGLRTWPGRAGASRSRLILVTQRALLAMPMRVVPVIWPCSSVIAGKLCGASHSPEARTQPSSPTVPSILVLGPKWLRTIRPCAISAEVVLDGV